MYKNTPFLFSGRPSARKPLAFTRNSIHSLVYLWIHIFRWFALACSYIDWIYHASLAVCFELVGRVGNQRLVSVAPV
jgi:hypothetical protein